MFIYKITSITSGKSYIGQTIKEPYKRLNEHLRESNKGSSTHFHNAIRKYSIDDFELTILEKDIETKIELDTTEIYYISFFNNTVNGYNMLPGGRGGSLRGALNGNYGNKWSDEMKKIASLRNKNKVNVRDLTTGKVFVTSTFNLSNDDNLEAESKGRKYNKSVRELRSLQNAGAKNPNAKTITIYDSTDNIIHICIGNFKEVCTLNNLPYGPLSSLINSNRRLYQKKKSSNIEYQKYKGWYARTS